MCRRTVCLPTADAVEIDSRNIPAGRRWPLLAKNPPALLLFMPLPHSDATKNTGAGAAALHAHTEENAMEEEICETSEDEERLVEVCIHP